MHLPTREASHGYDHYDQAGKTRRGCLVALQLQRLCNVGEKHLAAICKQIVWWSLDLCPATLCPHNYQDVRVMQKMTAL